MGPQPGRREPRVQPAAVRSGAPPVRSLGPQHPARCEALRAAGVHHGRRRAPHARVPAVRARSDRFRGPAAQHLAGDPTGEPTDPVEFRTGSVKRVLDLLAGMAKDEPDKYATFWEHFGRVLKEGVVEDDRNREQIAKLLRFASTRDAGDEQTVSLDDYIARMKGRTEGHLLHYRRRIPYRAQQPASRSVRQARPGGAAARRPD